MMGLGRRASSYSLLIGIAFGAAGVRCCYALDANGVLVLYNNASSEGRDIAQYYAAAHPGVRLLGLSNVPAGEEINVSTYLQVIRPQVRAALDDSIDAIVTTRGLPLRIYNDRTPDAYPYNYVDSSGIPRTIVSADSYKRYSSLESELTRVDTFSTWKQLGDQTWWYPPLGSQPSSNPYYRRDAAFSHMDPANTSMRLTARLDGYSEADVINSIRRAQRAYIIPSYQQIVVDDSPAAVAYGASRMGPLVSMLADVGQSYVADNTISAILTAPRPVIGYVSNGVNDGPGGLEPGYVTQQLNFTLANGAIFHTWESYNGVTFQEGAYSAQGQAAQWLKIGGTAAIAHVQEPGGSSLTITNEDRLFQMMLQGYSFGEAAWNATPQLSYVNTVIGDPLMQWKKAMVGDANLDGTVSIADVIEVSQHFGMVDATWRQGDFNGDGIVSISDLIDAISNFGVSDSRLLPPVPMPQAAFSFSAVPEPGCLSVVVLMALAAGRRQRNAVGR
jgi:uncharacterized protein (TIGR03790 family)